MFKNFVIAVLLMLPLLAFAQGKKDTLKNTKPDSSKMNTVQIDTGRIINQIDTSGKQLIKTDSLINANGKETVRFTNLNLFIYITISVAGFIFFFFLFVKTLFRTFHKTKSTRQSLLLSWNLFFIVSVIWVFIIWGIVAGLWSSAAFMTILIFLFIMSLIMSIIALKSK